MTGQLGEDAGTPQPIYCDARAVADWPIPPWHHLSPEERGEALRAEIERQGFGGLGQTAGSHWPIGCISLEITQRCNLDCSLCYLSDLAESMTDVPMEELLRRVQAIRAAYGPGTTVQISGGDPTLRVRSELIAITRAIADAGLAGALMTNGIRATRQLLADLARAGLRDIVFHVDMTQGRSGHVSEASLNAVRDEYIARASGLGLRILFNTTVFAGNLAEIPVLAEYFVRRASSVQMASFQLQADTGRGVLGARAPVVTQDAVTAALAAGAGTPLGFELPAIGHPACNRYASLIVAGDQATDLFAAGTFWRRAFAAAAPFVRKQRPSRVRHWLGPLLLRRPDLIVRGAPHLLAILWCLRKGLASGRFGKLTFFVHNFMDASALERDRCAACVFMVATRDGPLSMCVHNARRNAELLKPIATREGVWHALPLDLRPASETLPVKRLKGRVRIDILAQRAARSLSDQS